MIAGGIDPRPVATLVVVAAPWAGAVLGRTLDVPAVAVVLLAVVLLALLALRLRGALGREEQAVAQLAESERRFRLLAEHAPDVVFRLRLWPSPQLEYVSPSVEAITGHPAAALLADPRLLVRALHPEDRRSLSQLIDMLVRRPDATLRWLRPDGETVWTEIHQRPVLGPASRVEALEGIARDVTRARRAEEALREKERALETLLGNLPGVAYRLRNEDDFPFDFASAGCRDLTGYEPEDFARAGKVRFLDLVHPDDRARMKSEVRRALEAHARFTVTFRLTSRTGEERWVWDRGVGVYDGAGRAVAIEGFATDVTERRRAEEARERLVRDAEAALSAREGFLSMATHDLRSPLTALKLQVQAQLRRLQRPQTPEAVAEQSHQTLKRLEVQVGRMQAFVDELLDVTRAQAGRLEVRVEEVDLAALVREVAVRLQPHAEQAGCEVRVCVPGPVVGRWDWLRLEQVVTNLLSNALKYGSGKPVQVLVEADEGGQARLLVRDHGMGLEQADVDRLFRRFERLSSEHRVGSTGLGLWIVRLVVEALGGSIRCESPGRGQGTTFVVELPRGGPAAQPSASPAPAAVAAVPAPRPVEDEPSQLPA